jgi:hypothetical protein
VSRWIKLTIHPEHPKVLAIARAVGVSREIAFSMIVRWFRWVDENCRSEETGLTLVEEVNQICGCAAGGNLLPNAMASVGWIEWDDRRGIVVLEFDHNFSASAKRRAVRAEQTRSRRSSKRGPPPPETDDEPPPPPASAPSGPGFRPPSPLDIWSDMDGSGDEPTPLEKALADYRGNPAHISGRLRAEAERYASDDNYGEKAVIAALEYGKKTGCPASQVWAWMRRQTWKAADADAGIKRAGAGSVATPKGKYERLS